MTPGKEFLLFEDYLKIPDPHGWVTVAGTGDCDRDSKFVFSALATLDSVDCLLKTPSHEVHEESFGNPTFRKTDGGAAFEANDIHREENISMEPFVFKQGYLCDRGNAYEISQSFARYHDLAFDCEKRAHVDCEGEEIVRVGPPHMQVRKDALQDYLAARKMVLVLYYDHRRQTDASVSQVFGKERVESIPKVKDTNYSIVAADCDGRGFSRFFGKKIVRPYPKPRHKYYDLVADDQEKYMTYKCLENGEPVEKSCDVESGLQPGPFCTLVFFRKEVLSKYHNLSRYVVRDSVIWHHDLWNLPFGQNDDTVYAWLGDLGRIPYDEQMHWKEHNVMPRGGMDANFVLNQVFGEFAEIRSKCEVLLDLQSKTNADFKRRFGFGLFKEPSSKDQIGPHDLASNEEREFREQILNMSKVFVESLNAADLAQSTGSEGDTIGLLRRFLTKAGLESGEAEKITGAFRAVRNLRNGVAHREGKEYARHLRRLGLEKTGPRDRFAKVVAMLGDQVTALDRWIVRGQEPVGAA